MTTQPEYGTKVRNNHHPRRRLATDRYIIKQVFRVHRLHHNSTQFWARPLLIQRCMNEDVAIWDYWGLHTYILPDVYKVATQSTAPCHALSDLTKIETLNGNIVKCGSFKSPYKPVREFHSFVSKLYTCTTRGLFVLPTHWILWHQVTLIGETTAL